MKIFIHTGYPKTASTFLNDNLFSKHSEINLITKGKDVSDKIKMIRYLNDTEFEKNKNYLIDFFKSKISEEKINIFSDEMFLIPLAYKLFDNKKAIKRLFLIFSNFIAIKEIYFLIMIRNPKDFFLSYYTDQYHRIVFYDKSLDQFKKFLNQIRLNKNDYIKKIIELFDYYKTIRFLSSLNNNLENKIGIFLLEDLKHDKSKFSNKISSFLKINQQEVINLIQKSGATNITSKTANYYYRKYEWNIFFSKNNFFYKILPTKLIRIIKKFEIFNLIWFFKSKIIIKFEKEESGIINDLYLNNLKELEKLYNLGLEKNKYY